MQQFYANGFAMPRNTDRTTQVTVYPPSHIHNQNVFLQDPIKKIVTTQTGSSTKPHTNLKTGKNSGLFCHFLSKSKARIKYRCSKDVVPFTQRLRKIVEVPLMYRECTVSVRGVYRKGTGDLLRSYWRSTTDPLNACTSGVDRQYSKSRRVVGVEAMTTKVTLCLRGLRCFSRKLLSLMELKNKSMPSVLALICFSRRSFPVMALKNKGVLLYGLLCFMLFNLSDAGAQSAKSRTAEGQISDTSGHRVTPYSTANLIDKVQKTGKYDLDLYPWESYEIDTSLITKIKVGDSIPSSLLNLPLTVVGSDVPIDTITLNDLAGEKLLVIDFWTTWCGPCVGSMQKWEEIQEQLPDQVVLLGVHLDYAFKARPFIIERGWKSYTSIGLNAYVLNRHFFHQDVISRIVCIKDGRFLTVGGTKGYDLSAIKRFLAGEVSSIPARLEWTYSVERSSQ